MSIEIKDISLNQFIKLKLAEYKETREKQIRSEANGYSRKKRQDTTVVISGKVNKLVKEMYDEASKNVSITKCALLEKAIVVGLEHMDFDDFEPELE